MSTEQIPGTTELIATPARTLIRLGYGLTYDAAEIAAYVIASDPGTPAILTEDHAFEPPIAPINGAVAAETVLTYVRLRSGEWLCSSLTWREIDSRMRKAGATIL